TGVSEVSRFSCVKCLGVLWGLRLRRTERELALSLSLMLPSAITRASASGLHLSELNTQPTYSPVYASPCTSRCPAQNSGPSGSLLLSREKFSFSASPRFIPAHCNSDFSTATQNHYGLIRIQTATSELDQAVSFLLSSMGSTAFQDTQSARAYTP